MDRVDPHGCPPRKGRDPSRFLPVLLLLAATTACATTVSGRKFTDYQAGSVLVLPPRDVVQGGVPHAKGVGSGQIFLDYVTGAFQTTGFRVITTRNPSFDGTRIATREEALAEGKALGADYVLVLVLGEFLDAAPMTFRADSVTLQQAVMIGTASGNDVWRLDKPTTFQKTNIGPYTPLLDEMAQSLVKAIAAGS
jgi:hypothetical protein